MLPPDPTAENSEAIRGGFRRGGRGRGRRGRDRLKSWTAERGVQDGLYRLRFAKESFGAAGEGVREFCALVAKLCGQMTTETERVQTEIQGVEVKEKAVANVVGKLLDDVG